MVRMKKIIYLLLAVLGFSAAGCEERGAEMPMYACPAPEYDSSDSDDGCMEQTKANDANDANIFE